MRRLSYLVPGVAIASMALWARPSWWAVAMLTGGAKFLWDFLWGERRVLLASYGLRQTALGVLLVFVAAALAWNLGMDLRAFQATNRDAQGKAGVLYQMPAIGIGVLVYGLLIWSRAFAEERK